MLNKYQYKVCDCINDKIIQFSREEGKSLHNLETYYKYQLEQCSLIYRNPMQHYSKIMVIAYNKLMEEYRK